MNNPEKHYELLACAKVEADPMSFAARGTFFRGYYVYSRGGHYLTKNGEWTHGCAAPDDGNWWDTRGDAQKALNKFRMINETSPSTGATEKAK